MTEVVSLATQLIQCPSITPDDAGCQKIIKKFLSELGFQCEEFPKAEVSNLWARLGKGAPLFVFAGHTDVVPTGPEKSWTSPPFQPEVRDGFLYGRGATDMKSSIAAMMIATEKLLKNKSNFSGSIAFLITSDEEGPALYGTRYVLEELQKRKEKIDYCIVGEASSEETLGDQIRVGRRGSLHGKLIVYGTQGHVAYPHLCKNPIHESFLALSELVQEKWDEGNESFPPTTLQISNIHAGTGAANVIPGQLEVLFNFRFSTAVTSEELQARVEALLSKHQVRFDLFWEMGASPFLSKKGNLITTTQEVIKKVTGLTPHLSTAGGTSDGRFTAATGAEVIELGPCHEYAHKIDERVDVADLETLVECYYGILEKLFGGHG